VVATDTVNFIQNTLVKDIAANFSATVAPNPFNNSLELNVQAEQDVQMELRNHIGQVIIARQVVSGKRMIQLWDNASGIYYLHLQAGEKRYVMKLMKF